MMVFILFIFSSGSFSPSIAEKLSFNMSKPVLIINTPTINVAIKLEYFRIEYSFENCIRIPDNKTNRELTTSILLSRPLDINI